MLAYASNRPVAAKRQSSPHAMLFVVSAHVALLAAVMSAKMDLPKRMAKAPRLIQVTLQLPVRQSRDRPPPRSASPLRGDPAIDRPRPTIELPLPDTTPAEAEPTPTNDAGVNGGVSAADAKTQQTSGTMAARHEARLMTPPSELKPPYPASKLASEEEAQLRLRLTIDDQGRVIRVEPIGYADREFLDAARQYILMHWRYDPASENGRPITTTTVITLSFQLDG